MFDGIASDLDRSSLRRPQVRLELPSGENPRMLEEALYSFVSPAEREMLQMNN